MTITKMLKEINEAVSIGQQLVLDGETDLMEIVFSNGYMILNVHDGEENFNYKCKIDDENAISNLIIQELINEIYQKDLLPRKYKIKEIKRYLNRQLERIFKWKTKIVIMKKQGIYDLKLVNKVTQKLNEINENIYINWKNMDDIKCDLYEYEIFKDILFESLKQLP